MKLLVLTGFDERMEAVGRRTSAVMQSFAVKHGFEFECVRTFSATAHPSWQKLGLLLERLPSFDQILWLDADSLVTNPETNPFVAHSDHGWPMVASRDWGEAPVEKWLTHFSCGNFIVRRGAMGLLKAAQEKTAWANRMFWEQSALQELVEEDPRRWRVRILPRRALNAVPRELRPAPDPWRPGDFLAHLTAERNRDRLAWLDKFA